MCEQQPTEERRKPQAESARPCGCDPGAGWVCERHQSEDPCDVAHDASDPIATGMRIGNAIIAAVYGTKGGTR